jgi:hypothetical protein
VNAAATPEDARLSPDGITLWVVDPTADALSGLPSTVADSPNCRPRPPASIGAAPAGIVVTGDSSPGKPNHR